MFTVAGMPPKYTVLDASKFVPSMTMADPPAALPVEGRTAVIVGVGPTEVTTSALENTLVLPEGSIEVAVTWSPAESAIGKEKLNDALQDASVTTLAAPKKLRPARWSAASPAVFTKNSTRKVVFAVELWVPVICVTPPEEPAVASTGQFASPLLPPSVSQASFAGTLPFARLMPSAPLA